MSKVLLFELDPKNQRFFTNTFTIFNCCNFEQAGIFSAHFVKCQKKCHLVVLFEHMLKVFIHINSFFREVFIITFCPVNTLMINSIDLKKTNN